MASIYDTISVWSPATIYNKYDIVKGSDNRFYYCTTNSNVNNDPITYLGTSWDGYILLNGNLIPNFWWKPSYNSTIDQKPTLRYNQFGNGYTQRIKDGLNFNLIQLKLSFENRSEVETVSILHFLNEMGGQTSFIYKAPSIYSKLSTNLNTKFVCPNWSVSYSSFNNYTVRLELNEVPN